MNRKRPKRDRRDAQEEQQAHQEAAAYVRTIVEQVTGVAYRHQARTHAK